MSKTPLLLAPAHADLDSTLLRKYGKEVANYFSGSPLNRVSFLRADHVFLAAAVTHPSASFLLFNNLAPLAKDSSYLARLRHAEVKRLVGENPYARSEEQVLAEYNSAVTIPQLVFLGLDEGNKAGLSWRTYVGAPVFAIDVTPRGSFTQEAEGLIKDVEDRGFNFLQGRVHATLDALDAGMFAQARALLDWNARNPFCAQCGQPTLSINAGAKRTCPPIDLARLPTATAQGLPETASPSEATHRPPCATRKGVHNIAFPRTDPTVIMAVISSDARRILLGRQKRWPPLVYSNLAGFVEPGESVEEAVRREVWEESGVRLGRVVLHSSQPWPFPANLMIGTISQAIPDGETIVLDHDGELEQAKWFDVDEVALALRLGTTSPSFDRHSPAGGRDSDQEAGLRLPPRTAIAHQLLSAVVELLLNKKSSL